MTSTASHLHHLTRRIKHLSPRSLVKLLSVIGAPLIGVNINCCKASAVPLPFDHSTAKGEWPVYAGDFASTKYSPLTQINVSNFKHLKVAWKWNSPDNELKKKV